MWKAVRISLAWFLPAVLTVWIAIAADDQNSSQKKSSVGTDAKLDLEQARFMRKKLDACSEILEGLTTEDSELIVKGARTLVDMSAAEKFQVQHDVMYRQFSNDFQRSAKALLDAAEKNKFDTATLKWIDTTMKCMECHKFVRGARLAVQKQ